MATLDFGFRICCIAPLYISRNRMYFHPRRRSRSRPRWLIKHPNHEHPLLEDEHGYDDELNPKI